METIENIIETIRKMACDSEYIGRHKGKGTYFGRSSGKIAPHDVIFFVMSLIKTTLDFEVLNYIEDSRMQNVVASSITKARKKLSYTAFSELLDVITPMISGNVLHKGYRVLAVDGMQGELPKTPELMEKYNGTDSLYPKFHAVAVYDVLNKMYINASFHPAPTDERKAAADLVSMLPKDANDIILFDRGFPSLALIQTLEKAEKKYVMRVSTSFLTEVNDFIASDKTDETLKIDYLKRRGKNGRVSNVELPFCFSLRCVKVALSSGETETLITNLSEKEFDSGDTAQLYNMRWGIETSYNHLKNAVRIEDFVGILENSILQEFYASLLIYNLSVLFADKAQEIYEGKKTEFEA
jgi:hypothetical protein